MSRKIESTQSAIAAARLKRPGKWEVSPPNSLAVLAVVRSGTIVHVAAHEQDRHQRLSVLPEKTCRQGVVRPLVRCNHIGTVRVEREQRAAIVEHESVARHGDARTEPSEIAVDP